MGDDIIDRLRCAYRKGEEPPCEACTFCAARAEVERLREQIDRAHNIIGSEAMIWLIIGANHPEAHLDAMRPAVNTYWGMYGNAFRDPDKEARRG